jgi:hypothetical protein
MSRRVGVFMMKPVVLILPLVLAASLEGSGQRPLADIEQSVTEAEFRSAVQNAEQLAHGLQAGLKKYGSDLQTGLQRQGYGPHHPLFRTKVNGFEQDQIDLDALDQFKRGRFALRLQRSGVTLEPDPFADWAEVQVWLDSFTAIMDQARSIVVRASVVAANTGEGIPIETYRALKKRWRAASDHVSDAYQQAMAVRAVEVRGGALMPVEATVRMIRGGGRYAVICLFQFCTSQPASPNGEVDRMPTAH